MCSLAVIVLTYDEALHIERCLRSAQRVASQVFVVDSFSTDRTVEIARSLGAEVIQHEFTNHAHQFNWALENLAVSAEWIMRLDADEYLEPELQEELPGLLAGLPGDVDGVYIKRKVLFQGKWIRYGGFYPQILLRIWRSGKGCIENRWQDAHAVLAPGGKTTIARGHVVDDNRMGMTYWIEKHNHYASREALELLNLKYGLFARDESLKLIDDPQARRKRILKEEVYNRLPLGLRAGLYFLYRYVLRLGFLDGGQGFIYHFMQAWWYRLLVDVKIKELEERSEGNVGEMKRIFREQHRLEV
jgi:glycosyltransferase involved in cell wall biosynthesis